MPTYLTQTINHCQISTKENTMNKYVMNEESNTTFISMYEKIKALTDTHSTRKQECEDAMSKADDAQTHASEAADYAESAQSSASAADDSCDDAERQLNEIRELYKLVDIEPHVVESEVDKLVKLTGKSIEELKHILRYE